jgi:hypothetical protein
MPPGIDRPAFEPILEHMSLRNFKPLPVLRQFEDVPVEKNKIRGLAGLEGTCLGI